MTNLEALKDRISSMDAYELIDIFGGNQIDNPLCNLIECKDAYCHREPFENCTCIDYISC